MVVAIVWLVVIGLLCLMIALAIGKSFPETRTPENTQSSSSLQASPNAEPAACVSINKSFLADVRSRSCYAGLRTVHDVITVLGSAVLAVVWFVQVNVERASVHQLQITAVCALIAAALFIEYGLFRLIVDAVDVLIDTSRRNAGDKGSG